MKIAEVELDHAFADAIRADVQFQNWLIGGGRFARHVGARLLCDEQAMARPKAMHWWKHWWCKMPDGSEGETDIFSVWEHDGQRFAIHIENKPPHGKIMMNQAISYRRRAALKSNSPDWLSYVDFETILMAPETFLAANTECGHQFDRTISYEDVATFVPLMGAVL